MFCLAYLVLKVHRSLIAQRTVAALARAKQKAIQVKCLSNLKQLGQALQMCVDDNEDRVSATLWNGMTTLPGTAATVSVTNQNVSADPSYYRVRTQ